MSRFVLFVCLLTLPGAALAQTQGPAAPGAPSSDDRPSGRPIVPFLERSTLFWASESDLVFEAAVFPHLTLWQNFDDLVNARRKAPRAASEKDPSYWAFTITPGIHAKMFRSFSNPVRTPSYLPRFDVQRLWSTNYQDAIGDLNRRTRTSVDIWELHGALRHHSNGQDRCLYNSQTLNAGECTPSFANVTSTPAPQDVNKKDGSFSTNDWRVGLNFRRTWLAGTGEGRQDFSLGAEYQHQLWTDPDLKPFYSKQRINLVATGAWAHVHGCSSRLEASVSATIAVDHPVPYVDRFSRAMQISCFPSNRGGFGLFAKWYVGQDDYNLGFLENISRFQIGLVFNQDGFFRFRQPR